MGCCASSRGLAPGRAKYGAARWTKSAEKETQKNAEYMAIMQALGKVPLLRNLPRDQTPILAASCITQKFKPGETVIQQGDMGHEFYLIREGEATVSVASDAGPQYVATVRAGDYFGENALLHDEPRNATITADTQLITLKILRSKFQELGLHRHLDFPKRRAVCNSSHDVHDDIQKAPMVMPEKSLIERKAIIGSLRTNQNLQTLVTMDEEKLEMLANTAVRRSVAKDEVVIRQGDDMAKSSLFIVEEGGFDMYLAHMEKRHGSLPSNSPRPSASSLPAHPGPMRKIGTAGAGDCFGELALMYSVPAASTVQARMASSVWVIDRGNFKSIVMKASDDKTEAHLKILQRVAVINSLLQDEQRAVAEALSEMSFSRDEVIINQGEDGDTFYILYEGEVDIVKDRQRVQTLRAEPGTAQYFGERALINNEPRAATVRVVSDVARALVLEKTLFDLLLRSVKEALRDRKDIKSILGIEQKLSEVVSLDCLVPVGTLGTGAFGNVELMENKLNGKTYAVKMMSKGYIVSKRMQNFVLNEKSILSCIGSPFIIKLYNTAQNKQWIYFILEPALGGELYVVYHREGLYGSLVHARYYAATVVLAFQHLHERYVIYRDLKPENLLLNQNGFLKLTDMGLAKFVIGKTFTTCGTPEYFAPEVIRSTGQTRAVDWWTLGVLVFELLAGFSPFRADNHMQMYKQILKGINHVRFPSVADGDVEDVIKCILQSEPSARLPMRHGGVQNLKLHAWFKDFDWGALADLTMVPPFKPTVNDARDLQNFLQEKGLRRANWTEFEDDGSGWDSEF